MLADPLDGREYKMALARTRQAVAVHKAMQFNAQGNPARYASSWQLLLGQAHTILPEDSCGCVRLLLGFCQSVVSFKRVDIETSTARLRRAMVELRRALQENSQVREPLLNARYEKQEVSPCRSDISYPDIGHAVREQHIT